MSDLKGIIECVLDDVHIESGRINEHESVVMSVVSAVESWQKCAGNGWIKLDEMLPNLTGWYCVAIADPDDIGWSTSVSWVAFWNGDDFEECDPVEDGQPVTHWMPLPIPPND